MVSGYGKILGSIKLKLKIFNISSFVHLFVLEDETFNYDCLIGLDLIKEFKLCQNSELKIFQNNYKGTPYSFHVRRPFSTLFVNNIQLNADLSHLNQSKSKLIQNVIDKFNFAFASSKFDVGKVSAHEAAIRLTEHRYVSRKPYRATIVDQREIESQINELLKAGLIEESTSPFGAPVTLAYKKQADGTKLKNRLCIDYSQLNKIVVPESQPFPRIEDLIVKAGDCHWFSVLDINSAFWSVPVRHKDKYKTAFVTLTGHYNWNCLPFGLKTSPAIFQRILRNVLKKNDLDEFAVNYIDDILVFSVSFEQHLVHLKQVIEAIHKEGFRLSLSKCKFARNKVTYLGHEIENNLTRPIFDNVRPVRDFPVPTNQKQVRQFLGKVNFYHSYIPNSAKILSPLHNLLKKNVPFVWSGKCQKNFELIKNCLCHEPCLAIFSPNKETVVFTDASLEGIGAVMKQRQEDGTFKPVSYFSKKLNENQKKKKALFLECLAIKEALNYWRFRLLGIPFEIITDHKPLANMNINTKTDDELRELILQISQFNYRITYRPGKTNLEADCLSRNPVLDSQEANSELKVVNLINLEDILQDQKTIALQDLQKKIKIINKQNNVLFTTHKESNKIIISDEFAQELIKKVHFKFGHIGATQMELTILPFFYNVNLVNLIQNFVKTCSICIKNKTRLNPKFGLMSQLGPATKPFQFMSIDTIGGFAGNNSNKKYIHLLMDHFTRFAYAITSSNQKATDFIKLINLVLKDGSKIENLLSDQYAGLTSSSFKNFLKDNNINLIFTAVDCPFSNGMIERLNQTLVNKLRCKINENNNNNQKPWPKLFTECLDEYNNTVHTSTKFTPNYLMHGIQSKVVKEFNFNVKSNLSEDRHTAFLNSQRNHLNNRKKYDKNRLEPKFYIGQLVYIQHGNSLNRNKLSEIRTGPFKILSKVSNNLFEVDSGYKTKESNIFHVSKLHPFNM